LRVQRSAPGYARARFRFFDRLVHFGDTHVADGDAIDARVVEGEFQGRLPVFAGGEGAFADAVFSARTEFSHAEPAIP
jgi:hypothetical protein